MYAKIINNQCNKFPYGIGDLKKDNPNVSFPAEPSDEILAVYNACKVITTPAPAFDNRTHSISSMAETLDGVWTQVWTTQPLPENQASENVRADRNKRLADCDWTQLADAPVDGLAWAVYRQDLREVPDQEGFPWEVVWPEAP